MLHHGQHPRILFVDAYDSYSNNIVALVRSALAAQVTVVRIDEPALAKSPASLRRFVAAFDAVIAGPGPGSPLIAKDVGIIKHLWTLTPPKPVLGVCLGHQSLAVEFGASLVRLDEPRHGIVTDIVHNGQSIFAGIGHARATTYNSLHVDLGSPKRDLWSTTPQCPDLAPLAWALDDAENGPVCMAIRHTSLPFWGVQYHPESICTNQEASKVFTSWWHEAQKWTRANDPRPPTPRSLSVSPSRSLNDMHESLAPKTYVEWQTVPLRGLAVPDLLGALRADLGTSMTLLESGTRPDQRPVNPETGRFSILGCTAAAETTRFEYDLKASQLCQTSPGGARAVSTCPIDSVFSTLKSFIKENKASQGPDTVPFWGGLIGYISYEACLRTIDVSSRHPPNDRPGMHFVFVDRSIVIDHVQKRIYIQSIRKGDAPWLEKTVSLVSRLTPASAATSPAPFTSNHAIRAPTQPVYESRVTHCQDLIRAGESYELCLTDQTFLPQLPSTELETYLRLRSANPAPFSSLLHFPGKESLHILSSSVERFLNWSRPAHSTVQFRPIKGTVRKGPGVSRASAEAILNSPKEQAENLMIVDLIRHDLYAVAPPSAVRVSKLMSVEEYETVFQLVSVIEGDLPAESSGIDVLARSLPPGSMTGAPKKRSCELLQDIEDVPRDIYSGVLGYLDVGGGGDFAVVIRTAFKWDNEPWRIGAGGAVTVQSSPLGEWEEMMGKRDALLKVFGG